MNQRMLAPHRVAFRLEEAEQLIETPCTAGREYAFPQFCRLAALSCLKHLNSDGFKQQSATDVLLRPWHRNRLHDTTVAQTVGNTGSQRRLKLHRMRVTPSSLSPMILHRAGDAIR